MKYLFLDTNIYLHYTCFEQIDWKGLLGCSDFSIIIPPIVIREIDKIKDIGRGKIQIRAKKISATFGKIFLKEEQGKIDVYKCNEPNSNQFNGVMFNKYINDDWFILSVLNFDADANDKIVISSDNNLLIKAKEQGLKFYSLDDKYRLTEEPSRQEREIKELQKELLLYKNRMSIPKLFFADESNILKLPVIEIKDIDREIAQKMEQIKYENPYAEESKCENPYMNLSSLDFNFLKEQDIIMFNKDLDIFLKQKEENLQFITKNDILSLYLVKLKFIITNTGTAQTGKMNIFINFPGGVKLYNEKSKIKKILHKPLKPKLKPFYHSPIAIPNIDFGYRPNYEYCWDLEKEIKKRKFSFEIPELNHSMKRTLDIDDSIYVDIRQCGNFDIDWTIIDSSLPKAVMGKLKVIINSPK